MKNWHRNVLVPVALPLLVLSVSSCASLGNFIWNGHWEDPNAQPNAEEEVKATPPATEERASNGAKEATPSAQSTQSTQSAKPIAESKRHALPLDTVFTRGSWFLLRTSRGLYTWTGKGEQFRIFAIELQTDADCWSSQQGGRPEAEHCPDSDAPVSAITKTVNGQKVENIFSGFEKAPWKTAQTGTPLAEGTYDLPESSGKEKDAFTLECKADEMTIRTARSLVFTVPSASNAFLVNGERPDLFDGCTDANGVMAVSDIVGIRFGQKKCGALRRRTEYNIHLIVDKAELEFDQTSKAPDIAGSRVKAVKLRQVAAENKAQLILDMTGDASHTIMTAMIKRPKGEEISMVEGVRTIEGIHHKCEGKINKMDATWVRTAKQVCGSMVKLK